MRITLKQIKDLGPCKEEFKILKKWWGERKYITANEKNFEELKHLGLDIRWAVDKGLIPKNLCLSHPDYSYRYALYVDKGPRDDTRKAVLSDPDSSYLYALYVDKGPRDDTRKAILGDPYYSYRYARDVDKGPRDTTLARPYFREP